MSKAMFVVALVPAALLLGGCPVDDPQEGICAMRAGGALVRLDVVGEQLTAWVEDDAFIDEALAVEGQGVESSRIPLFGQVRPGTDCDGDWSWHVDPNAADWVDVTIELCDGRPSYIEENLDSWIEEVGSWCPWSAEVVQVIDLR